MRTKTKLLFLLACFLVGVIPTFSQNWEYINLRQYRVTDVDELQKFLSHAYPYFNKSQHIPVVNRVAATSETGRIYAATYFSDYDQYANFLKEWNNLWDEYSKSPGNLTREFMANMEAVTDDILYKLNKELTNVPAGFDASKSPWRKLHFVLVKDGKLPEFEATWKKIRELEKKAGINYPEYVLNAVHGEAPTNTILISLPAENAIDYYTKSSERQKIRQANPEIIAFRKKLSTLTSNTVIDQITMIGY